MHGAEVLCSVLTLTSRPLTIADRPRDRWTSGTSRWLEYSRTIPTIAAFVSRNLVYLIISNLIAKQYEVITPIILSTPSSINVMIKCYKIFTGNISLLRLGSEMRSGVTSNFFLLKYDERGLNVNAYDIPQKHQTTQRTQANQHTKLSSPTTATSLIRSLDPWLVTCCPWFITSSLF